MLLQFSVANYKSFREETTISFVASGEYDYEPHQVVELEDGTKVLRVAAIYGANAAGKSNLIDAMRFLATLVEEGVRPGREIPHHPHRALGPAGIASVFTLLFVFGDVRVRYRIAVNRTTVRDERLDLIGEGGGLFSVFSRREGEVELGPVLDESLDAARLGFYKHVAEGTRANQPFLAELTEREAFEWSIFSDYIGMLAPQDWIDSERSVIVGLLRERENQGPGLAAAAAILGAVGTGITDLAVEGRGEGVEPLRFSAGRGPTEPGWYGTRSSWRLVFEHAGSTGKFELGWSAQSDGTRRLLQLIVGRRLSAKGDAAVPTLVDELDRSLHIHLSRYFLRDTLANPHPRRQVIFTTHDTNLLDRKLVSPDGVWFVEKDETGASRLHSLADYPKEQLDQIVDLEKGYLQGRFGGIPFIGDPEKLGWVRGE